MTNRGTTLIDDSTKKGWHPRDGYIRGTTLLISNRPTHSFSNDSYAGTTYFNSAMQFKKELHCPLVSVFHQPTALCAQARQLLSSIITVIFVIDSYILPKQLFLVNRCINKSINAVLALCHTMLHSPHRDSLRFRFHLAPYPATVFPHGVRIKDNTGQSILKRPRPLHHIHRRNRD